MVMFANDRLYSFANVVEHEDNNVFRTNDKTVVLYMNNFEDEILQIVVLLFSILFFFCKMEIVIEDLLQIKIQLGRTNLQTFIFSN